MAEYHVGAAAFGIYCGILNKPAKDGTITWRDKTECTDEALRAVCDFLLLEAKVRKQSRYGYEWGTKDGKSARLVVEIEEALNDGKDSSI